MLIQLFPFHKKNKGISRPHDVPSSTWCTPLDVSAFIQLHRTVLKIPKYLTSSHWHKFWPMLVQLVQWPRYGLYDQRFKLQQGQQFFCFPKHPEELWGPLSLICGDPSPGSKQLRQETDHASYLMLWLRKSGVTPPLSLNSFKLWNGINLPSTFIFCWPCISVQFLLITNLTHFFNVFIYLTSLHVSSNPVLIIMRINRINTSSGMYHSV